MTFRLQGEIVKNKPFQNTLRSNETSHCVMELANSKQLLLAQDTIFKVVIRQRFQNCCIFLFQTYFFERQTYTERVTAREGEKIPSSGLLLRWVQWAGEDQAKTGVRSFFQVSMWVAGIQVLGASPAAFPGHQQVAGLEHSNTCLYEMPALQVAASARVPRYWPQVLDLKHL